MTIIYIQNLLKKKISICRALFDAAANTEKGKMEKILGTESFSSVPGLWGPLQDNEIEEVLQRSDRFSGFLLEIGYLQVNLRFKNDSVDVTYYEETYELSAKIILEAAGFTCSDKPISSSSSSLFTPYLYSISKNNGNQEAKAPVDRKIEPYSKDIESDNRFKKSSQDGVIFAATSFNLVSDADLIAYGAKRWERKKDRMNNNIVLILEMEINPKTSPQPKGR